MAVAHILDAIRDGDEAFSILERCLTLKERGFRSEAFDLLQAAAAAHVTDSSFPYESAVLLIGRGELDRSIRELEKSVAINPQHEAALLGLCLQNILKGNDAEALALLSDAAPRTNFEAGMLLGLVVDLREDQPDSIAMIGAARDTDWQDAPQVAGHILDAVADRRPFALVRLGDGEGSMFKMKPRQEFVHGRLLHDVRTHFTMRWYSEPYESCRRSVDAISSELKANLPLADVVGLPDDGWVRHEFAMANSRGLLACLNARRAGEGATENGGVKARTSIHYELLQDGWFAAILAHLSEVAVVSCHAQVKQLFEQECPALKVQIACVSPAFSDLSVTGLAFDRPAYKQIDDILGVLDLGRPGTVVLIGAGFIGKLLALRLKQMGHIALDVGSLFDLLLGYKTRSTLQIFNQDTGKVRSLLRPA